MSKIRLLDCTLRDGGYINNWEFGEEIINKIITGLSNTSIDIVEIGFITGRDYGADSAQFNNSDDLNNIIVKKNKQMHVGMIAIGEKELDPKFLKPASESKIDGIRLTFHDYEIDKAFKYGQIIKDKGYKLFMQPVGTTLYSDKELIELIEKINKIEPFAFYLVDTLGVLYPNDFERFLYLIDNNLAEKICLGFHSHNNLQLSFSNAQRMLTFQTNRELIIDCSIFGMGRGAGNLCTEMIAEYMNKTIEHKYNIIPMLEIIDELLIPIFKKNPWGYSAGYFLSSINYCHPNYTSHLLGKQSVSVDIINVLLQQIPDDKKGVYNKVLIEEIYQNYQNHIVDDKKTKKLLADELSGKKILLIASGSSIDEKSDEVNAFIKENNPIIISVNFIPENFEVDYVFISNNKRYNMIKEKLSKKKVILSSNIMKNNNKTYVVNYADLLNNSSRVSDNAGLLLIKLLEDLGKKELFLAGFDGFNLKNKIDFVDEKMVGNVDPVEYEKINQDLIKQIKKIRKRLSINFLTPSLYDEK